MGNLQMGCVQLQRSVSCSDNRREMLLEILNYRGFIGGDSVS